MKNALYNGMKAISSSSLTTIVGLIVLVFMSFTIGKDLGFVLAKGVLFSLITIFFVLPALIVMFDKLIEKTKKKSPIIKLDKVGKISYKCRHIAIVVFAIIFIASFLLKGNLGYNFSNSGDDEISKVFSEKNQMVAIYKTEDEEKVANYLETIENDENVIEVLGYSNTINEKLKYNEVNDKLEDLEADSQVEDYILRIIYYNYYNQDENNTMTCSQFVNFIKSDVYANENLSLKIDERTRKDINKLENFTNSNLFNKNRTSSDLASILDIDKTDVDDLLIYYNSKNNNLKIGLNDFINFMNNDVISNNKYSSSITEENKNQLNKLQKFTSRDIITSKLTNDEIAELFGIDKESVTSLFTYYKSLNVDSTLLTINEFSNFILNNVATSPKYKDIFTEETLANIKALSTFSNTQIISKQMNSIELSNLLGIEEESINALLLLKYQGIESEEKTASPQEIIEIILYNKDNEMIKNSIDTDTITKLSFLSNIMNNCEKNLGYNEISTLVGLDETLCKNIYTLVTINSNQEVLFTPQEFVNFVLEHINYESLKSKIDTGLVNDLNKLKIVMDDVINDKKYSSSELSNLLGINKANVDLLFGLYTTKYANTNTTLSLYNFVKFILNDVITNSKYSSNFDNNSIQKLKTVQSIMNSCINGTKYNKEEIFGILSNLANSIDKNTVDILYTYYGSINEFKDEWTLTIEEIVNYANNVLLNDSRFSEYISDNMEEQALDGKNMLNDSKKLLTGNNYSRFVINTKYSMESEETSKFIQNIKDTLGTDLSELYIVGDSPMAYEMSQTFDTELNNITILTMIAIFIVVLFTFKSLPISLILVLTIQSAVFMTMGILSFSGENTYFIAILIVQSILMGATIDYAILYTSYYIDFRKNMEIKEAIINSYNNSIHTILTSASILIIVTLIVGNFASDIASKVCMTISKGTICSSILILVLLPSVLAGLDKIIVKKK